MCRFITAILSIVTFFTLLSANAAKPSNSVYLDGGHSKIALILSHGRAKHPTWKVVDPLRQGVHEKLQYHTLSLQMPNEDKKWREYSDDFPVAYATLLEGVRYLKEEKAVTTIFLMGHSMGSRMVSAFVSENPDQSIAGLIVAGCRNNGGYPLSCEENLQNIDIPVLDIWGGNNNKDSDAASERKDFVSARYQQVEISDANHKFEGHESEFVSSVIEWLKRQP